MGGPGSGKSIFAMQYLYNGATQYNESGIYITLEEIPDKIRRNMLHFGWNLKELEDAGKLVILDATSPRVKAEAEGIGEDVIERGLDVENLIANLEDRIEETNAVRIVIDSLSVMGVYSKTEFELRTQLLRLSASLSDLGCTTLIVAEANKEEIGIKEFPPETYMFDGVITLLYNTDSQNRTISIRKMRGTKHVLGTFNFKITEEGVNVNP